MKAVCTHALYSDEHSYSDSMAYEDGLDAINGDTIYDLDIGQNSLSASDRGESITSSQD